MENRIVFPRQAQGKGRWKVETGQGNRQVLGDIGNLEVVRIAEGKQNSRPITRSFHAKLLASGQTAAKVIVPELDKKASVHKKNDVEDLTSKPNPEPVDVVACGISTELEDHLVDIDANYVNAELAAVEYLDDLYKFYKLTEDESRASDYMNSQHEINPKMRSIIVDWLVDVHRRFKLMPETLYLTINIFDRYLSVTVVPKKELQSVGISSMLIASKYEEIYSPQVKDFVSISDDAYTNAEILNMEKAILEKLEWYLTVPTPYVFLVRFIKASTEPDHKMENLAFYLAELGLLQYQTIVLYRPSMIAAAAVYAAQCTLKRSPFWSPTLMHQTGYSTQQIIDCTKLLVSLHSSAADSELKAVYQKFSSPDREAVSLLSPTEDLPLTDF